MDGGVACTPMRLGADMTVKDLKAVAAATSGIASPKKVCSSRARIEDWDSAGKWREARLLHHRVGCLQRLIGKPYVRRLKQS